MAGQIAANPTFALQPSAEQVVLQTNYITNFDFLNQIKGVYTLGLDFLIHVKG